MNRLLSFLLLIPFLWSCETFVLRNATEEQQILTSGDTGYSYEITVLLPPNYDPNVTYPSVYLIDGHWHYLNVAGDAQQLMNTGEIESIILVSIAYADLNPSSLNDFGVISEYRVDDLTFPKNNETDERGGASFEFRKFLKEDLIPFVEANYSTDATNRTLMGHSLGGYLGIWEMLTYPDSSLFQNIEAGSPALWWADGYLLSELNEAHENSVTLPFNLHTTMGSLESVVWNAFFDEFVERLDDMQFPGLTYKVQTYPKGHTANAEVGYKDGLIYFFGQ